MTGTQLIGDVEDSEEMPKGVCHKEYDSDSDSGCGGKNGYTDCPDPEKTNPDYCHVLQDWPKLLKSLTTKSSVGVSMTKTQLIVEEETQHCPYPEQCSTTYSACTDPKKTRQGYCNKTISGIVDPEQFIREDIRDY